MPERVDVLIRGAGPVGCALALALAPSGLRIALLEQFPLKPGFRPLALSYASRLILERIGAWQDIGVTRIDRILVSQSEAFGRTRLDAGDAGVPALGYVTGYRELVEALRARLAALITREAPVARFVVHAEGSIAEGISKRYGQDALVARLRMEGAPVATAFERFTPEGPLALLPYESGYALVWSMRPERAHHLVEASDADFLVALKEAAGPAPGNAIAVAERSTHPLQLSVRRVRVTGCEIHIGNAAQTLHPVAGQGLNLGLRDAWQLARALGEVAKGGDERALERYAAQRRLDAAATIAVTDLLAAGFLGRSSALRFARGAALAALDATPVARRFFARRMIFGTSALP